MIYIIYTSEMSREIYAAFLTRGGLAAPFHIRTRVLVLQTSDDLWQLMPLTYVLCLYAVLILSCRVMLCE